MEVQDTAHKGRGIFCHDEPFYTPVARAALLTLTASKLGLELQAGVYCIAFETLCDAISKIYNLSAPHVINKTHWQTIRPTIIGRHSQSVPTPRRSVFRDAENIKIAHAIDIQIIMYDVKCVGDILGTEFCWPKEKRSNIKSLFTPYRRLCLPKI